MIKNIKFLGNYGMFFISVSLVLTMMILFFNYSMFVEITNNFQSSVGEHAVPIWIDILSIIGINFVGMIMALILIKGLKDMIKTNMHQAQKQKVEQQ